MRGTISDGTPREYFSRRGGKWFIGVSPKSFLWAWKWKRLKRSKRVTRLLGRDFSISVYSVYNTWHRQTIDVHQVNDRLVDQCT